MKNVAIALAVILVCGATATATIYRGYADEFIGHTVDCTLTNTTSDCNAENQWPGSIAGQTAIPTWEHVGQQGANAAGRANAREKTMFRFRDVSTTKCESATVTLTRFRVTSPPAVGSSCGAVGGVFVGSVSQNWQSCAPFAVGDYLIVARMLPVFDFSADTSLPGQTVGYRSMFTAQRTTGTIATGTSCYQIDWF